MTGLADLHIHTTASDGTDLPASLPAMAAQRGLRWFAVTDHDTIDGALELARRQTPGFVMGIEFSCVSPRGKCHILGYGFDPADPVFCAALAQGRRLRQEKLARRLEFLAEGFGVVLTEAELQWLNSQNSPGKPHLAKILVDRGLAPDRNTAIRNILNRCKSGEDRITARTAIDAISHAGGIPVWAHPLGGEGEKRLTREAFAAQLQELMGSGIRGLECCYSRYDQADTAFLLEQARANGLLISGGSDYHGANKANIELGKLNDADISVDAVVLTILDSIDFTYR